MNGYLAHTQIQRVFNLVPGQKQFFSLSSFFSLLYHHRHYYYSCSIRYCISGPNSRTVLASSTTMGNGERTREGKKDHSLCNHAYQNETYNKKKFNVQCTHTSHIYISLVKNRKKKGRPFFRQKRYRYNLISHSFEL